MAKRVFLLGATGTIGRATLAALIEAGHEVVCFSCFSRQPPPGDAPGLWRQGDVGDLLSITRHGFAGEQFGAIVSCMASRTGAPEDAWAIDYQAHSTLLTAAREAGIGQMVLLSAICVQRPRLAFQHAKLAFERELMASGLDWSIVRPTAYFKSLSGQVARVKDGKPFLVFGNGRLTACKPISDRDLGRYIVGCLDRPERLNRILPIGGPGPAITPLDQAAMLARLLGREVKTRQVPVALLDAIAGVLSLMGRVSPRLKAKAELARIGRYYATESMLVWDEKNSRYDAETTPEFGGDGLEEHYVGLLSGKAIAERGEHAVF